jgi:hypothetical protein
MSHSQGFKEILLQTLIEYRWPRMIAGERPGHPIEQHLVKVASGGKFLPKNALYGLRT